jgi:serine/threonine protein kinase
VDWWSLGTLLYEMLCGLPPFYDTNIQRMYNKILQAPLRLPSHLSEPAKDILNGLLQRKVEDRIGSGSTDAEELKATSFFAVLDFDRVYKREYQPEFMPPAMYVHLRIYLCRPFHVLRRRPHGQFFAAFGWNAGEARRTSTTSTPSSRRSGRSTRW